MPGTYTYPGVYIEEVPSQVRTITGVSTSDTAFVGFFKRGPMNEPVRITSLSDFNRQFGGLDSRSEAGYAIQQYYLNGGQIAWVVRVASGNLQPAVLILEGGSPLDTVLQIAASSPGLWGKNVEVAVGHISGQPDLFNLVVRELGTVGGRRQVVDSEIFLNLSMDTTSSRFVKDVVNEGSSLIRITSTDLGGIPDETGPNVTNVSVINDVNNSSTNPGNQDPATFDPVFLALGDDPDEPTFAASDGSPPDSDALINGMKTLDTIAPFVFNLLCLPDAAKLASNAMQAVYTEAESYCEGKRAFLIVDIPPAIDTPNEMGGITTIV